MLHGTPTTAGSFPVTVTATNGVAPNAVKSATLVVAPVEHADGDGAVRDDGLAELHQAAQQRAPEEAEDHEGEGLGACSGPTRPRPCSSNGVPAGTLKYPVASGQVKVKGTIAAGASCSTLTTLPIAGNALGMKWKGVNPKNGKLSTAGGEEPGHGHRRHEERPGHLRPERVDHRRPVHRARRPRLTLRTDLTHAARLAHARSSGTPSIGFTGSGGASTLAIV